MLLRHKMLLDAQGAYDNHWHCKCNSFYYYLPKGYAPKGHPATPEFALIVDWENRLHDEDKSRRAVHG